MSTNKRSKGIRKATKPKGGSSAKDQEKLKAATRRYLELEVEVGDEEADGNDEDKRAKLDLVRYTDSDLRKKHDFSKKIDEIELAALQKAKEQEERDERKRHAAGRKKREAMNEDSALEEEPDDDDDNDLIVNDDEGYANSIKDQEEDQELAMAMPTIRDPKLWQVAVAKGSEKLMTMSLMNKQVYYAGKDKPLAILSVSYLENLESVIFVEAFKLEHVREAIEGLKDCYQKVAMLPADEMLNIYNTLEKQLQRPVEGQWVRIKNGLYIGDLGIIDYVANDEKIYVKMIPRIDPASYAPKKENDKFKKKRIFQRNEQMAFSEQLVLDINPALVNDLNTRSYAGNHAPSKTFRELRKNLYRKGFIYKPFNIKQIDTLNIKPRTDERQAFLEIFERFHQNDDDDSSDGTVAEKRAMLRNEKEPDLSFEDKVFVTKGDLQGSIGTIKNFQQGGQIIILKPLNLEGLDEITVEKELIVKYFGLGDAVMITEGKYKGESALIMDVNEDNVTMPLIKIDSSHMEVRVNTRYLRMRDLIDTEKIMAGTNITNQLAKQTGALSFKVGDMINYDNFRVFGHVISVDQDTLSVVNDQGRIENVKISGVDKKLVTERRRTVHDSKGNAIQMEDTVFVNNNRSPFFNQQGIIKNICRKCLFLWDPVFINMSNGIFVSPVGDVLIKGYDMLVRDVAKHQPAQVNQNRIGKSKLLGQIVVVQKGDLKGLRGRVGHVNSDMAFLEIQGRLKRVTVPLIHIVLDKPMDDGGQDQPRYETQQEVQMPAGGATEYQKGETEYQPNDTVYGGITAQQAGGSPTNYYMVQEEQQPTWGNQHG